MNLPMVGTTEKNEASKYQVTLVEKTDRSLSPMEYPRIDRFFDNIEDRNVFVMMFEASVFKAGGKLVQLDKMTHPLFSSFAVIDNNGLESFEITVYH